ncbi:hypothetical protein [Sorangium sp. So ce363]
MRHPALWVVPCPERLRQERVAATFEKSAAEGEPEAEATEGVDPGDDER